MWSLYLIVKTMYMSTFLKSDLIKPGSPFDTIESISDRHFVHVFCFLLALLLFPIHSKLSRNEDPREWLSFRLEISCIMYIQWDKRSFGMKIRSIFSCATILSVFNVIKLINFSRNWSPQRIYFCGVCIVAKGPDLFTPEFALH